jgi:hypothetical protein
MFDYITPDGADLKGKPCILHQNQAGYKEYLKQERGSIIIDN